MRISINIQKTENTIKTTSSPEQIRLAADKLRAGSVVAFPTETVYGLGAEISQLDAIQKIFEIKGRPRNHPLIVHFSDIAKLEHWTKEVPPAARLLAEKFWPGPLTLILSKSRHIPLDVTGGQNTVGLRIPRHPVALALLQELGPHKALAAPSANRFGRISPTTTAHVKSEFNDKLDMILDGGECEVGLESTIISCDRESVTILRPGGISVAEIEDLLKQKVNIIAQPATRVSGSLKSHYAPVTPLEICRDSQTLWHHFDALRQQDIVPAAVVYSANHNRDYMKNGYPILMPDDPIGYGKRLYATLRDLDQMNVDRILVEAPPAKPEWAAIIDRLQRASAAFPSVLYSNKT